MEAKRTTLDAKKGQQQAKLYADRLEAAFGQRPVMFGSNGYEHWMWDDLNHPPHAVQGFYRKDELELLVQRRTTRKTLADVEIDAQIVERYYQTRAIRRVAEAFEQDNERKAQLVMATGAGKTRTVIALSDLLMRANCTKRVLFLADRIPLVDRRSTPSRPMYAPHRPVGVSLVRELHGVVRAEHATAGILVTTSSFTKGAKEFRETVPHQISLRDYFAVSQWIADERSSLRGTQSRTP